MLKEFFIRLVACGTCLILGMYILCTCLGQKALPFGISCNDPMTILLTAVLIGGTLIFIGIGGIIKYFVRY